MTDLRTPAERAYDDLKSGAAYTKPEPGAARLAAAAPTITERIELLLDAGNVPSGDQIFDLVLDDRIAGYVWSRCIDWVLWRQAHGLPVKVLGDPDRTSAAIDARFSQARDFASPANCSPYSTERDVALVCAGQMIEQWERTPAEDAKLREDTAGIISILEAIGQ